MNDDYSAPTWTPEGSGVTFHFSKRKVIPAWELEDIFRVAAIEQGMTPDQLDNFVPIMMGATGERMKQLRVELFKTVTWSKNGSEQQQLLKNEDAAFADLGPDAVYTVMLRSLTVNFTHGTTTTGSDGELEDLQAGVAVQEQKD